MKFTAHNFPTFLIAKDQLSRALDWWVAELYGLVPSRVTSLFRKPPAYLFLVPQENQIAATLLTNEKRIELPALSADPSVAQIEGFKKALQAELGLAPVHAIIDFDKWNLLVVQAEYPLTDEKTLQKILLNEFARVTPFKPEEVYWEWAVHTRNPDRKRLVVKIVMIKRTIADRLIACVSRYGLSPVGARLIEETAISETFSHLLPSRNGAAGKKASRFRFLPLAAIMFFLSLLVVGYTYGVHKEEAHLKTTLSEMRPDVEKVENVKQQLEALSTIAHELKERGNEPTPLMILNEVTQLTPDDTWLFDFRLNNGKIRIAGFSSDPSRLIGVISSNSLFTDAKFLSPVTASPNGAGQRFELSFSLRQAGVP